jgi:hypothetical protein
MQWTFRFPESVFILQVLAIGFIALSVKTVLEGFLLATRHERIVTHILVVTLIPATAGYAFAASVSAVTVAWTAVAAELVACAAFALLLVRWSANATRTVTLSDGGTA